MISLSMLMFKHQNFAFDRILVFLLQFLAAIHSHCHCCFMVEMSKAPSVRVLFFVICVNQHFEDVSRKRLSN